MYATEVSITEARDVSDAREPHPKHARAAIRKPLRVVTCIFNPQRYQSRWALFEDFAKHVTDAGASLTTIQANFGEREGAIDEVARRYGQLINVRVDHLQEIWLKENLLNLAVQQIPDDERYIAFVDADVLFTRPDWVDETIHQLQHYHVVQMFSEAVDMNPTHERIRDHRHVQQRSHTWCHLNGGLGRGQDAYGRKGGGAKVAVVEDGRMIYRHPGFAWAWRREALDAVGGLMEHVLLGSADWHMAWALVGRIQETFGAESESYRRICLHWQRRAVEHIKGNIGYVQGTLLHRWHGKKTDRGYQTRWKIMADHAYNPDTDLKKDSKGVLRLTDTKPRLRDDIRTYFRMRNEDSVDE